MANAGALTNGDSNPATLNVEDWIRGGKAVLDDSPFSASWKYEYSAVGLYTDLCQPGGQSWEARRSITQMRA